MTAKDYIYSMQIGEEIEISVDGHLYFLQPQYETANEIWSKEIPPYPFTVLFDSNDYENPKEIFIGTAEEIVNYVFDSKYTIKDNPEKFKRLL